MNIGEKDGSRSHRSRKKRRKPYKITGIESMNLNNSKVGKIEFKKKNMISNIEGINHIE